MNKIHKQNRNRLRDRENSDSCHRRGGLWGWVKKGLCEKTQEQKPRNKKPPADTDNSMVITRGKGGGGGRRGQNG